MFAINVCLCLHCVCLRPVTCGLIALYICELVFDVWDVCEHDCMLRVFDPGRLLVVRIGNLNELTIELRVFDPGRLLVVRVET